MLPFPRIPAGAQRVILAALAILPLLIVVVATIPALLVLPFLPHGTSRLLRLIEKMIMWLREALAGSRSTR